MKSLNIRKKLVTLAVASALGGGAMMAMTAPAHAMNVSQNNVGQVLLFPYYTVKNGMDTIFTVTNTSAKTAIFKIRFREALNSREVRDFNVILSPYDHWNGAVTSTSSGPVFRTYDKTCTSPMLPGMDSDAARALAGAKGEINFSSVLLSGDGHTATSAADRLLEGYFEVILMGVSDRDTSASTNTLEYNAKHAAGVPRSCEAVDPLFLNTTAINVYMDAPENILKGHVTYINVNNGTAIDAEPTAIEDFQTGYSIVYDASSLDPDLGDGDTGATIYYFNDGTPTGTTLTAGASSHRAVSGLLAATSVVNEFATGAGAATSWVLTFPTKHHYTDATGPVAPFSERFQNTSAFDPTLFPLVLGTGGTAGKSCDNISLTLFNREEGTEVQVDNTKFSPYVPTSQDVALCYEVNVVDFNSSSVFGTGTNRLGVDTSAVGTAGWAALSFVEAAATEAGLATNDYDTLFGLPVIGFAATVRDAGGAAVNYGSSTEHSYVRSEIID